MNDEMQKLQAKPSDNGLQIDGSNNQSLVLRAIGIILTSVFLILAYKLKIVNKKCISNIEQDDDDSPLLAAENDIQAPEIQTTQIDSEPHIAKLLSYSDLGPDFETYTVLQGNDCTDFEL